MDAARMTRENKLALVIGFGLLLVAGILVSDHLSAQQRVDEDSLVATEALVVPDPSILQPKNAPTDPLALQSAAPAAPVLGHSEPKAPKRREIVIGTPSGARASATTPPSRVPSTMRFHHVKKGENLSEISKQYFGTPSRWQEIASANNITNANSLPVGTRLVIASMSIAPPSDAAPKAPVTAQEVFRITTVREGDTLSGIAKRELGSAKLWPELWEANKATLPNSDSLTPGMTLQVPASSTS